MPRAYKNVERGEETRRVVWAVLRGCWMRQEWPTAAEVAAIAGVPRPTAYRHLYWFIFRDLADRVDRRGSGFLVAPPGRYLSEHVDSHRVIRVLHDAPWVMVEEA